MVDAVRSGAKRSRTSRTNAFQAAGPPATAVSADLTASAVATANMIGSAMPPDSHRSMTISSGAISESYHE
jgi:hypothetical protein